MLGIILDPRPLHAGVHFQEGGSAGRAVKPGGLSTNHVAVICRQNKQKRLFFGL